MPKDFHNQSFDSASILKLDIIGDYLEKWIPVFLNDQYTKVLRIYDWFCGPGQDSLGRDGSPKRIFSAIAQFKNTKNKPIEVWFNDRDKNKVQACEQIAPPANTKCIYTSQSYETCLDSLSKEKPSRSYANFFFIDPTGLLDYAGLFNLLYTLPATDFLLFIPSSHIGRFSQETAFKKYLPDFPPMLSQKEVPKFFCNYIKQKFHSNFYLVPFSIKKENNNNVHALIFGSKHLLGLDKFLSVSWSKSKNGEANFALEGDFEEHCSQYLLFDDLIRPNKIKSFQNSLQQAILSRTIKSNHDIYIYTISAGFLPIHSREVLNNLKNNGILLNNRIPGITYKSAMLSQIVPLHIK